MDVGATAKVEAAGDSDKEAEDSKAMDVGATAKVEAAGDSDIEAEDSKAMDVDEPPFFTDEQIHQLATVGTSSPVRPEGL